MLAVFSTLLVTTLALGEPPAPRSRAPIARERIDAMLTAPTRHVRGLGTVAVDVLERGARRSYTFARLLDTIENSDVIVYVETRPGLSASLTGRMLFAGSSHGQRYLRIQIAPASEEDMIATLGHELQHAIEVADAPEVHDEDTLSTLYQRIGHTNGDRASFDTVAAREVGRTVRSEIAG